MKLLYNIRKNLFLRFVQLVFVWTVLALIFQTFMIITSFTNPKLNAKIGNEIMWKIDGTFKNNSDNIWYEKSKTN